MKRLKVVNFYSTGDEALELSANNNLWLGTGLIETDWTRPDFAHHCWHKQELFKGRAGLTDGLGGTKWAGWSFNNVLFLSPTGVVVRAKYDASAAAQLSPEQLRNDPVFNPAPSSMTNSVIPLLVRGAILAQGIPALAPPTGGTKLLPPIMSLGSNFNLQLNDQTTGIEKPNGWPTRFRYQGRWLHSDMKDMAFYYTYKFYEKVVEKGSLK